MPAGNTYEAIATTTVGTQTNTVTFSSISSSYTDLILVVNAKSGAATGNNPTFRVNGDSGSNYSYTFISGNGSSTGTGRTTNATTGVLGLRSQSLNTDFTYVSITHFMNYSNATTYKSVLTRSNDATLGVEAGISVWRSTAAITSIDCIESAAGSWAVGSTLTLYGIKAA